MKANELMKGDWVIFLGKYRKVCQIGPDNQVRFYGENKVIVSADELDPIPLTPEILEKNGFEKQSNYQWKYRDNSCKIVISIAPQIKIDGEIIGTPPISIMLEGALFDIDITSDCYVHFLQHCFRLVGIEKEIVL